MAWHDEATPALGGIHQARYISQTDPALDANNRVTANKEWVQINGTGGIVATWYRNAGNTAWLSSDPLTHSFVELTEQAGAVAAPSADRIKLYAVDVDGLSAMEEISPTGFVQRNERDSFLICRNSTGQQIAKGTVVRATGVVTLSTGEEISTIAAAQANSAATMPAIGIAAQNIAAGATGRVMRAGKLSGVNTAGLTAFQQVYVSTSSAGGYTTTRPDQNAQSLGTVISVSGSGSILVRVGSQSRDASAATVPAYVALTDGATITWATAGAALSKASVTLGGNRTLSITGAVNGSSGVLIVKQDATGGRTLTLPAGSIREGGALTLSTAANAVDVLAWEYDGTNYLWTLGKAFA